MGDEVVAPIKLGAASTEKVVDMAEPYAHLEFAPQAPQAPINHAVGVTSYAEDSKDQLKLAAQWAPLGRVMNKRAASDELTRNNAVNGTWTQTQICQRRKKISETVTLKTKKTATGGDHFVFAGIARDPAVSTPDRDRSPQMSVCNRGLIPAALPYLDDEKQLTPGTLAYFDHNDTTTKCHGTLAGNQGVPTSNKGSPLLSSTKDVVGTVLSCGKRQHAMIHLHPLSNRSFKRFTTIITNGVHAAGTTIAQRVLSAFTTAPAGNATGRFYAGGDGFGQAKDAAGTDLALSLDPNGGGQIVDDNSYKHVLRINIGLAVGGETLAKTANTLTIGATTGSAAWTKKAAFATTLPTTGGAPRPVAAKAKSSKGPRRSKASGKK